MPESQSRKKAKQKKAAKNKQAAATKSAKNREAVKVSSRAWVPWVFVPMGLLGVIWLGVYYIGGQQIPLMYALSNWNFVIGLGLIAGSFFVATLWK
ncbi:MAG: cell division protein CrgA [Propionibacterium sp.]|nr:cell division protein CrgA [Propionibacterium sp.]